MKIPESINSRNRKLILLLGSLLLIATLFPPFEWNHSKTFISGGYNGYIYERSSNIISYIKESSSIKTYDFLFGYNQKTFYSDLTKKNETFTRTLNISELALEYIAILLGFGLLVLVFPKKN